MSSGTVGAAMSAALSRTRAIALSYGNFQYPPPPELIPPANRLSLRIIQALWNDWGRDEDTPGLSHFELEHMDQEKDRVQIQGQTRGMRDGEVDLYAINIPIVSALLDDGMKIVWTRLWRNAYSRLFKQEESASPTEATLNGQAAEQQPLVFTFSPDWKGLLTPTKDDLPYGTDAWGIHSDMATVTPLKATFGEPGAGSMGFGSEHKELANSRWAGGGRFWDAS
jgi:tubulin---tyrosine ligase